MLIVLLEFQVKPGMDDEFIDAWNATTINIYQKLGSLGSKLHRSDNGVYIGYAQWPSEEVYDQEHQLSIEDEAIRERMRQTLVNGRAKLLHKLTVVSDLTQETPFQIGR